MKPAWTLAAALFAISASSLHAADCASLKSASLPQTTIALAQPVTTGTLQIPGIDKPFTDLPAFCRVTGSFHPSSDSDIHFELWLPDKWNGRYLGIGNGGFAGSIGYGGLAAYLIRGFAVAGSDAGHNAGGEDAGWALHHPEKIKDFGWRAVHVTADNAKTLISAYYSKPASKAYFDSCSDGGREALMEAQRFPSDYNGILAGAPANNWSRMLASGVDIAHRTLKDPAGHIPAAKLPAIERASLNACDAPSGSLDNLKDGLVSDPAHCHFDTSVLLCKAGTDSSDCLTQPQIDSLNAYYSGGKDSHGNSIFPGFVPGDEQGWSDWIVGTGPGTGSGSHYVESYFRNMITGDAKWDPLTANVDQSLKLSIEKGAPDLDSTNPDLSQFAAHGGKLILYHGWNDPAISPWNTIDYYQSVQKNLGEQKTAAFVRLYMVPGMEHCAGGPGPNLFGQFGLPSTPGAGIFDALETWEENGSSPAAITALSFKEDHSVKATRPICPYPAIAQYKGTGSATEAASFTCTAP
ncbi:MAG TPA: tannase/feruloyl esterase family alpha/beta hydrolase [Acidobacteriaceae bacterium]|jgi:feruloyl esterase|nr:tannase/feruloyl esterase family alpha/beta hydrolase [Acidobacteriaceae bacterium]